MVDLAGLVVLVGTFAAAAGSVALLWYLDRHRGEAGATWFVATLGVQTLAATAYGVGLLTFAPAPRALVEALLWVALAWIGPLFLVFVLTYTGRRGGGRARLGALFAVPAATTVLAPTTSFHGLVWREFRVVETFGLATVLYELGPWSYVALAVSLGAAGVGVLLLVQAVADYGPLYRREAVAVALSTLPPVAGLFVWLAGVGPRPALNLTPLFLLPHVALDAYAFVGTHMFETNPATRRAAERTALDGLDEPLVVLDTGERAVDLNAAARRLFDVESTDALPAPLVDLVGTDLAGLRERGELTLGGPEGGVYAASCTPLSDPRGDVVGETLVLYDITDQRRREQQLTVINRILRHNLRNELTVVRGYADGIAAGAADDRHRSQATAIVESADELLSTAAKVREFAEARDSDVDRQAVDLDTVLSSVAKVRDDHPDATVTVERAAARDRVRTDPELLARVLENLVENAVTHAGTDAPTVTVRVTHPADAPGETLFEVRDDNDPIPDVEVDPLRTGDETALTHGSGVGLWVVNWCVVALDGTIGFDYDDGNVVRVWLPTGADAA
ncbi:MAG: histidine kinase N-terminal 7TM domain-containing protein [Haloferacaceae archaeon]